MGPTKIALLILLAGVSLGFGLRFGAGNDTVLSINSTF